MLFCVPLRQQPHASSAEDVERCLFVFVLRDVSSSEAKERLEVVTGLRWFLRQGGDTWENHQNTHILAQLGQTKQNTNYNANTEITDLFNAMKTR